MRRLTGGIFQKVHIPEAECVCLCAPPPTLGSIVVSQLTCSAVLPAVGDVHFMAHEGRTEAFPQIAS